ncbi:YfmQ family protein [Metabacillus fastidiosus]|uniref:YfmQ family protein n=1 Tax=Metabacillus fastidiosus TaxID=1458 RepID=UPI003D2A90AC
MLWPFVLFLIVISVLKLFTNPPSAAVEWVMKKFELHSALNDATTTITIDGKHLEGEEKNKVIHYFNEASFLEKYTVQPETSRTPLVIDTKKGDDDIKLFVYSYDDHLDVIKKYKKKVISYRLRSDNLQKLLC